MMLPGGPIFLDSTNDFKRITKDIPTVSEYNSIVNGEIIIDLVKMLPIDNLVIREVTSSYVDMELDYLKRNKFFRFSLYPKNSDESNLKKEIGFILGEKNLEGNITNISLTIVYNEHIQGIIKSYIVSYDNDKLIICDNIKNSNTAYRLVLCDDDKTKIIDLMGKNISPGPFSSYYVTTVIDEYNKKSLNIEELFFLLRTLYRSYLEINQKPDDIELRLKNKYK